MAEQSFLGRGWAFPPFFARRGADVVTVDAAEDVEQSLRILMATRPGERVLRENFGCDLSSLLFEEIDQALISNVSRLVSDAILLFEPRIEIDRLKVEPIEGAEATLLIEIDYTLRGTNSRYNFVHPFYLNEAAVAVGS